MNKLMNDPLLELQNFSLQFKGMKTPLFSDISLQLQETDHLGICGPSGTGKSMFLRSICLLEPKVEGTIFWQGNPIKNSEVPYYRSQVMYVPQKSVFFTGTVEQNLKALLELQVYRDRATWNIDQVVHWFETLGKPASFLNKDATRLSGGEGQVSALVRALLLKPKVLCLDEPTSALDADSRDKAEQLLQSEFAGAWVWVTHDDAQLERIAEKTLEFKKSVISSPSLSFAAS